ncbi:hypothetical protein GCM10010523_03730 [Paenarthrobacter ilicis]
MHFGKNVLGISAQFKVGILLDPVIGLLFSHGGTDPTPEPVGLPESLRAGCERRTRERGRDVREGPGKEGGM